MKSSRILLSVFAAALVMGCSEYDDSALWKKVDEAQKQLAELSASLTQLEGQIALLTAAKTRPLKKKLELIDRENRVFEHDSTFFTFRLNNRFSESYFYR